MSVEAETYGSLEEFERANESQTGSARRRPVCDRCGRELGTGLPSPCSECSPAVACEWFALCANRAVGTVAHPVLGSVPTCERCAAKLELVFEEVSR